MSLDRLWAGWRMPYVSSAAEANEGREGEGAGGFPCVFCAIRDSDLPDSDTLVVWRGGGCFAVLNLYPYTSGHLLVMPYRHVAELEDISGEEGAGLWRAAADAIRALKSAYEPQGINVGANLGRAAGAGIPGHFHLHVLPRWGGDTNFMTSVADARVLPEFLADTWARLRDAWPD